MTKIGNAYRWVHGNILRRPINFSWVVDKRLAGCGLPTTREECDWLVNIMGIKSIITVREEPLPKSWITKYKIEYLHLKVDDFSSPSIEELDNTVDYMIDKIDQDESILVHCLAGKGRTGTVLAGYLIKNEKINAQRAIEKVRILRPGSIQTDQQENTLYHYENFIKQ